MMLKTKVDIHVFSAVENFFFFDMLSLENIISDMSKCLKQAGKTLVQIPTVVMILYEIICNTIITSKLPYFPPPPGVLRALIYGSEGVN